VGSCKQVENNSGLDRVAYQQEIDQWHDKRINELKSETGWLNLAGLFWLKEGINTFGSDKSNDLVFPEGKIAPRAGFFLVKNGVVQMNAMSDVNFVNDGRVGKEGIIFHPDSIKNPILTQGALQWFVIKRDDQVAIRLRDLQSRGVEMFLGIERYEVDPALRVEATLEVSPTPKKISITNVLGQTTDQASPGTLVFELEGQTYRLDALDDGNNELFIIFGDPTNENETYPSGRYLYAKIPDASNKTVIDFNKSINPPCAFTPFATCPLPPSQNVLPIAIKAGEKNYKGAH
jgi:uncharacterized protein (DUF1684 family)